MDMDKLQGNLERRGFSVQRFATGADAVNYLDGVLDGRSVGVGGSVTIEQIGLAPRLATHNTVVWHWTGGDLSSAAVTEVYLSSCNAIAETGEIVNIDGTGNRVASTVFGHKEVYFLVGCNKVTPNLDGAIYRARNVAGPRNAVRLGRDTPCAATGDRCFDCTSPARICRTLSVLFAPPTGIEKTEILLIDEVLGY